jgi:hypothetical protein
MLARNHLGEGEQVNIKDVTHHDLARLTHQQRVKLARFYKVPVDRLPARLALRTKLRQAHMRYRNELLRKDPIQPDAHIYRCKCGAWTSGNCTTCAILQMKGNK